MFQKCRLGFKTQCFKTKNKTKIHTFKTKTKTKTHSHKTKTKTRGLK